MDKTKRFLSILITLTLTLVVIGNFPQSIADATTSSRTYYVYNAITGNKMSIRTYTLYDLPCPTGSGTGTNSVFTPDDRQPDYTKSGTVKIMNYDYYLGSGFVVDDHTIATAAHVVAATQNFGEALTEILLFSSTGTNELSATPIEYHIPANYFSSEYLGGSIYDYALISVEEDLSDYCSFYLGVPLDAFLTSNAAISVTGFPEQSTIYTNDHDTHNMLTGSGNVKYVTGQDNGLLYYDTDTSSGNSGGPAYITTTYYGETYYSVVAVHTSGVYTGHPYNHGVRITSDLLHFYLNNSNIVYDVSSS